MLRPKETGAKPSSSCLLVRSNTPILQVKQIREALMSEWKTVFDGKVVGRPVKIEVYGKDDPNAPTMRVTSPQPKSVIQSVIPPLGHDGRGGVASPDGGAVLIEVDNVEDLIGELEAAGFNQAQIDEIVGHLP
jgi:hypothetical protein